MLARRTRLKRKSTKARTNRLETEGVSGTIGEGQQMLKDSAKGIAVKVESSEFMDDDVELIVKKARGIMQKNPGKDVMLKVELYNEPGDSAGVYFFVHADDLVNYNELQAEDSDTGNIYTIRRSNIRRIVSSDINEPVVLGSQHGMNIAG